MKPILQGVAVLLLLAPVLPVSAEPLDTEREVLVVTRDDDGELRERRIWFAWNESVLYVRTTPISTWGANVGREGRLQLRSADRLTDYEAVEVVDPEALAPIHARFRAKYGSDDWWADRLRALSGGKVTFRLRPLGPAPDERP